MSLCSTNMSININYLQQPRYLTWYSDTLYIIWHYFLISLNYALTWISSSFWSHWHHYFMLVPSTSYVILSCCFPCNLVYLMILIKFEIYRKLKLYGSLIFRTSKNVRYKNNFNRFSPSSVRCPFSYYSFIIVSSLVRTYFFCYSNLFCSLP